MPESPIPSAEEQQAEIIRLLRLATDESIGDFYGGKRRHLRYRLFRPFDAEQVDAAEPETLAAHLQDISTSGVSFWCKNEIEESATVRIREYDSDREDGGVWISARVTHSTPGIRGHLVGAAFDHPVPEDAIPVEEFDQEAPALEPEPQPRKGLLRRLAAALGGASA